MCDFPRVFTRREACTYYNPFPNAPAPKSWNYCIAAHPAFVQKRKYAVLSERLVHVPLKIRLKPGFELSPNDAIVPSMY